MVPDPAKTSLGLEYFCAEGDDLWRMGDRGLIDLARGEIERIGLARAADVEDGCVFRVPKAYPVYDASYREALAVTKQFVAGLENLQTIGRNGLHRYNNQDHAMLTGMVAARNLALGRRDDVWAINTDEAYHEEVAAARSRRDASLDQSAPGESPEAFPSRGGAAELLRPRPPPRRRDGWTCWLRWPARRTPSE